MIDGEIKAIKYGQKVPGPGIYRIPMGWYHDDCCPGPSISSSGLRTIDTDCPLDYFDKSPYNPDRAPEDEGADAEHFRLGRAAHTLSLEPATFRDQFVSRPAIFTSWRSGDAKKWRADAYREGKTVLDPTDMDKVVGMARAIKEHPLSRDGLFSGAIECSVVWQDPRTGIWLKSRPDAIPESARMYVDLKSANSAHPKAVFRSIRDLGYDMQLALGGVGLQEVLGLTIEDYALFIVASKRPHATFVQPMSDDAIYWARLRLRRSINRFKECFDAGYWPAYDDRDGEEYTPSGTDLARLEREQRGGLLPKEF